MSLDQNLMGLGMAAALAARVANAGTGPISITAKGSSLSTGALIGGKQFVCYVGGTGWLALPAVGGDFGPEIGDDFVLHNSTGTAITVGIPSGVTVSLSGSGQTSSFTIGTHQTVSLWVVSSTQWMGQAG